MFSRDEYAEIIRAQLVPLDVAPLPTLSQLLRYYLAYCAAVWFVGGAIVWALFL